MWPLPSEFTTFLKVEGAIILMSLPGRNTPSVWLTDVAVILTRGLTQYSLTKDAEENPTGSTESWSLVYSLFVQITPHSAL